jgi:hypothetical protein
MIALRFWSCANALPMTKDEGMTKSEARKEVGARRPVI